MTKVALYARYSSDNQSVASIEDQFRVCRERARREGWKIVGTHHDAAVSGASMILRPGVRALLQDAQRGMFDLVLAEALGRVSRDQADVATLFKHLRFAGVEIVTLAEGEISELHVGLNNELYVGKLVWNRLRYVKDPTTGKRVLRINPPEDWITSDVPELQIVDDALWRAVKARQGELAVKYAHVITATRAAHANRLNGTHRPRSLLSGLLVCGSCGEPYALRGQDRYACSNHVMNGSCANSRTIARETLEARMLAGLRDRLMAPEIAAEAMRAYVEETNRLNRKRRASGDADRRELDKLVRSMKKIVTLIEDGGGSRALVARLRELEAREDELKARLGRAPVDIPDIHPNVAGIYRRKVEHLAEALRHPPERDEAAEAIRGLIERITLTPGPKRGEIDATLHGDLGTILEWTARAGQRNKTDTPSPGVSVSVVAGVRSHTRSKGPKRDGALPNYPPPRSPAPAPRSLEPVIFTRPLHRRLSCSPGRAYGYDARR